MEIINQTQALKYLRDGKTVIFPTETSYGLGCDATNQEAVDKIFKIKGRRNGKPLLVVVPTIEMAKEFLEWNELLEKIAKRYWPGAVTIVGRVKSIKYKVKSGDQYFPCSPSRGAIGNIITTPLEGGRGVLVKGVMATDNTIATRVTKAEIPKFLSEQLGRPVVATSANLADLGDVYDAQELIKMYEGREFQPDGIIDVGILPKNLPTTIVSVVDNDLKVLRQGGVVINPF